MTEITTEKLDAFRADLEELLDKHGFTGVYRQIIEANSMEDAQEQLNKSDKAHITRAKAAQTYARIADMVEGSNK